MTISCSPTISRDCPKKEIFAVKVEMRISPNFLQSSHGCISGSNLCCDIFILAEIVGDQGPKPKIYRGPCECNITIIDSNVFSLIQFIVYRVFPVCFLFIVPSSSGRAIARRESCGVAPDILVAMLQVCR